jgi:hypothetical protein
MRNAAADNGTRRHSSGASQHNDARPPRGRRADPSIRPTNAATVIDRFRIWCRKPPNLRSSTTCKPSAFSIASHAFAKGRAVRCAPCAVRSGKGTRGKSNMPAGLSPGPLRRSSHRPFRSSATRTWISLTDEAARIGDG